MPEGQLVNVAQSQAMANVKIGIAVFPLGMNEPTVAIVVLRAKICVRSFIQ